MYVISGHEKHSHIPNLSNCRGEIIYMERRPEMKDDHIAYIAYACLLGKNSLRPENSTLW